MEILADYRDPLRCTLRNERKRGTDMPTEYSMTSLAANSALTLQFAATGAGAESQHPRLRTASAAAAAGPAGQRHPRRRRRHKG